MLQHRDPLLPGHRWQSPGTCHGSAVGYPPSSAASTPARHCLMPGRACDSTSVRWHRGHPGRQAQSISTEWGLGHTAGPETFPWGSAGLARDTAPSSPSLARPGQSRWLPPRWGDPAAGTHLWAPSQAPTWRLECERHLPAQERAKK